MEDWDICLENMKWNLSDGKKISFWIDSWSTFKQPIAYQLNYTLNTGEGDIPVSNYIKNDTWDLSHIQDVLPNDIKDTIYATFIPNTDGLEDKQKVYFSK